MSDRQNIREDELKYFRELAELYAKKSEGHLEEESAVKALVEICL